MAAIAHEQPAEVINSKVDEVVEEHEEAFRHIEENFLIRDRFDLSEEDAEILEVIERSREDVVSEEDIESLVRKFFNEYGGRIRGVRPGPARKEGDVFQLTIPGVIAGGNIENYYERATFTRQVAVEDDEAEFIALDHPLVQNIVQFCLQTDRMGGQTAVKVGAEHLETPGLLCNYRIGYLSGQGETVTERIEQIYVTPGGDVSTDEITLTGGIPPEPVDSFDGVDQIASIADSLVERAEDRAWSLVNKLAGDAQMERTRDVEIKRNHAERFFDSRINDLEETLEKYRDRQMREETDMTAPINRVERELSDLQREYRDELQRLDEDEQVVPDEPELINTAIVIGV